MSDFFTKQFVVEHLHSDVNALLLQKSRFPKIDWPFAVAQIEGRQKVLHKLPTFVQNLNIVFPKKLSVEQCSSELTAGYKSQFAVNKRVLDATGGFGVDSFYLAKQAQSVTYLEQQADLCEVAKHNFAELKAENITVFNSNSIDFLQHQTEPYDLIYIDPARRGAHNSKKFLLSDCEPDVVQHWDLISQHTSEILIKASPMLDISLAMAQLRDVAEVHVISVKNECKEILFYCKKGAKFRGITCVNLDTKNDMDNHVGVENFQPLQFSPDDERQAIPIYTDFAKHPPKYIYDPFVCLTKAGAFKILCKAFGVEKMSQHAHLYTSPNYVPNFPGRHFEILTIGDKQAFSKPPINSKANIVCKHFPRTPEDIRKAYKIADGGDYFLFFTTDQFNQKVYLSVKRIN
ncbi:MAG: class I SAM-dependent methyltransferase [Bacteroidales bacterium]|jgi:hypothetical protein|nr:class I SAM-dependent methyltransferase [Bacteroidales bacterium]